jgi:ribosomal protein L9
MQEKNKHKKQPNTWSIKKKPLTLHTQTGKSGEAFGEVGEWLKPPVC